MCDTAMCQVVAYSDSLGSHLDHNLASPHMKPVIPAEIGGCNFSFFPCYPKCDIKCNPKKNPSMHQKETAFWPDGATYFVS